MKEPGSSGTPRALPEASLFLTALLLQSRACRWIRSKVGDTAATFPPVVRQPQSQILERHLLPFFNVNDIDHVEISPAGVPGDAFRRLWSFDVHFVTCNSHSASHHDCRGGVSKCLRRSTSDAPHSHEENANNHLPFDLLVAAGQSMNILAVSGIACECNMPSFYKECSSHHLLVDYPILHNVGYNSTGSATSRRRAPPFGA